jgi:hypothetical protein
MRQICEGCEEHGIDRLADVEARLAYDTEEAHFLCNNCAAITDGVVRTAPLPSAAGGASS